MSGGIFISYRRDDSAGFAGRIYDRIAGQLNRERVFFDVDNIQLGADFVRVISDRVGACDALVAIIGRDWLSSRDQEDRRRLDDPDDFVRIEIETALQRDIPVIPVLVDGAVMPRKENLPDALKPLARRQGLEISHPRFDTDSERLTKALAFVEEARRKREEAAAELDERQRVGVGTDKRAAANEMTPTKDAWPPRSSGPKRRIFDWFVRGISDLRTSKDPDQDYEKLISGSIFIGPDGRRRKKP